MNQLVQERLAATDWGSQRASAGRSAAHVPIAVEALLEATTEDEAEKPYWSLDNTVVVQGQLFASALPLVPALLAGLDGPLSPTARAHVADLLIEIASGWPDRSEVERGNDHLGEACRDAVRKGIDQIHEMLQSDDPGLRERALHILKAVERDRGALARTLRQVAEHDTAACVRETALEFERQISS
jgi:hypothetical protein